MLEVVHTKRERREKRARASAAQKGRKRQKKKTKQKGKVEIGNKHEKTRKINYCVLIIRRFL